MSDIDQIIAGGAKTNANFDFGGLLDSFYKGRDEKAKNDLRTAFQNGVPTDASGNPDFGAMAKTLFQRGGLNEGANTAKLGLTQQQIQTGQAINEKAFPTDSPVLPPSSNRNASVPVAPPLNRGGVNTTAGPPQQNAPPASKGDQPGSIVGMVSGAGVPDELAGPIIAQVSAITRTDPNAAVNPTIAPRVAQIVQEAVRRSQGGAPQGQPAPPQGAPPPAAAMPPQGAPPPVAAPPQAPPPAVAQSDPTLGGLVPRGRTPQQQIMFLRKAAASGAVTPEQSKVYETAAAAIEKALEPTPDMKNARASGMSLQDYQNRADDNTAQRDIMNKSLLPRIDASQERANAARDDIMSIHNAREQLDAGKGIFSGTLAEKRMALAKVYAYLGGDNAKIANTESYGAAIGQRVASMVKAFGSGTAISDGDRRFASAMAGGNISLDEASMRRILDIGERVGRARIDQHKDLVDRVVKSNSALDPARESWRVDAPGEYKKAGETKIGSKADFDKLPSGATFTDASGKQWRKP